ncbi:MAG: response regulator transcription factor [Clostridia bacterium]|nr:response regulator transcription factor [Clostridia bacterium]
MENQPKKILLVEDEKSISDILAFNLRKAGFAPDCAYDGEEGLRKALSATYDIVLLDIMLPKLDGFKVLEGIRTRSDVPVIMVTARDDEKDKIAGLENGADDYITKPFSVNELIARIRANIRRSRDEIIQTAAVAGGEVLTVRGLSIDRGRYVARRDGEELELSKKEYDLLLFLMENVGKPFSREDLLGKVWGYDSFLGDVNTVEVTVSRLRKKLEKDPSNPEYLITKRGVGYYIQ